ncbi:GrpB family protein [Candidatus Saccharibacteria bacterium]|jgi:GrpB-like predicted nucleotidyltransferase (UPF0157 family)|nr:GrpB family protein [Candidatus Saccharibacteria bacterium]
MSEQTRLNRKNGSYTLVAYDPKWVRKFEELKDQLAPVFGNNLVSIDHIGSTSIPGMLAKPTIDVCVVVNSIKQVTAMRSDFESLGYIARGDYVGQGEEYFVLNDDKGKRKYNIHTVQKDNPAIEKYLSFRDYLRVYPKNANHYREIKEKLLQEYGENDFNSYDYNKGDQIKDLQRAAIDWYRSKIN